MKFRYEIFSCDVDLFTKEDGLTVRFYNKSNEQDAEQISDLVIVDPGYGFLCIKSKGKDAALLSGYLDESVFTSSAMVGSAIDFVLSLFPAASNAYVPHHVRLVKTTSYEEYNGEY